MTSTVLDVDACVSRLITYNTGGLFKTIVTAFEMNPIEDSAELPAAYLYPGYVDADPVGSGAARQQLHDTLIVDVVCETADLRDAVALVRDTFIGWEMDAYHSPFILAWTGHMQGQACGPIDLKGGIIHWQERFQNASHTKLIHN